MNDQRCHVDIYSAVPQELKELHQWVIWISHLKGGDDKPSKILYQTNGWAASTKSERSWQDYHNIVTFYRQIRGKPFNYRYRPDRNAPYEDHQGFVEGIGFVFSPSDPYCGIDLDNCLYRDDNGGWQIKPWAQTILERLKPVAYREISPSGIGIKCWTKARLPDGVQNKIYIVDKADAIEIYDKERYFTVTGLQGKGEIGDGQDAVDWIYAEHFNSQSNPELQPDNSPTAPRPILTHSKLTTDQIVQKIQQSRQFAKFNALMDGNTTSYGSQSEADIALCSIIAFWTQDTSTIDAIFRQSDLMRPKWDEVHKPPKTTYGQMTIDKALSGKTETYQPRQSTEQRRRSRRYGRRYRGINQ